MPRRAAFLVSIVTLGRPLVLYFEFWPTLPLLWTATGMLAIFEFHLVTSILIYTSLLYPELPSYLSYRLSFVLFSFFQVYLHSRLFPSRFYIVIVGYMKILIGFLSKDQPLPHSKLRSDRSLVYHRFAAQGKWADFTGYQIFTAAE